MIEGGTPATLEQPVRNYVGAEWLEPTGEGSREVVNPATGEPFTETPFSSDGDVDAAVETGHEAFEEWRHRPVEERIQPLFEFKALLEEHVDDLASVIVTEHGKTLAEARGELRRGIENVEVACGAPTLMQAGTLQHAAPGIDESAIRHPLGVFAAITPFNFPGMIPLWFLPYAVATGNAFVLKPSERTPLTARALIELLAETSLPDGVVSLINGGPETVERLLAHDDVVGASFVGSTPVAKSIYETAAKRGKRVQAQGGAKNHVVVSDSANLEYAAEKTISSAFANSGQRCLANPIAVVHDDVYEVFADLLVERARDLEVGPGDYPATDVGPLVSEERVEAVREYVETGVEEGASLLLDGRGADVPDTGYYLGPTIFGDVIREMTIAREEIFGPVLGLVRAESFEAAVETVNASRYGNAASLFTERGREAREFRTRVEAGNVGINVGTAAPMAFFHFGGRKDSFFGDLHGQAEDVVRFYTDETVYIERWPDAEIDAGDGTNG
ncbi:MULTISPECIES: CoA-acylating methylmalonate-semialdehyde dehydrogenase [Natrialbaceae]|uniref:CoA-acylating methylmalonate-semialdehyde dehydrogenase n=1 Tax=Natrialbaceae TaxID=1644061 RepID=UPI00207C3BA7|nr:CoA-acylating methylmalonate-semialdehyde dehydrogenase [Natronococcus sp. CG52]